MSTRSTTHFVENGRVVAIIYRHSDGYPSGAGSDILRFLDECAALNDSRFGDPSYLASKYVVFLADIFNRDWQTNKPKASKLDFISVGVVMEDPGDIEYRYTVECGDRAAGHIRNGKACPVVKCFKVSNRWDMVKHRDIPSKKWQLEECEIPEPVAEEDGTPA